jgi:hypothetical protein
MRKILFAIATAALFAGCYAYEEPGYYQPGPSVYIGAGHYHHHHYHARGWDHHHRHF